MSRLFLFTFSIFSVLSVRNLKLKVMKKVILIAMLVLSVFMANAEKYRVKYNVNDQREVSFIVDLKSDQVLIQGRTYLVWRMGSVSSSGVNFRTYAYGNQSGTLGISTTQESLQLNRFKTIKGYILLIDNKGYLADRID